MNDRARDIATNQTPIDLCLGMRICRHAFPIWLLSARYNNHFQTQFRSGGFRWNQERAAARSAARQRACHRAAPAEITSPFVATDLGTARPEPSAWEGLSWTCTVSRSAPNTRT
jgi:hypothetical protein